MPRARTSRSSGIERRADSPPDLRYPGRRHGARLWRFHLLRSAGAAHHRRHARQVASLHRLDAPAALRRAARLRDFRRHPPARRLSGAGRRSRPPRPRRLGAGGNGRADLRRHLPHGSGERLAAAEDTRAQAQGARRADRGRRLARARGAACATCRARACSRTKSSATSPCRRRPRSRSSGTCARCPRASSARAGARRSSLPWRGGSARDSKTLPRPRAAELGERHGGGRTAEGAAAHDLGASSRRCQGDRHRRRSRAHRRRRPCRRPGALTAGGANCSARRRSRSSTASSRSPSRRARSRRSSAKCRVPSPHQHHRLAADQAGERAQAA